MVPVRQRYNVFFIVMPDVGVVVVMDDKGLTPAIGVLALGVRVVPVRAGLVNLYLSEGMHQDGGS